MYNEYIYEDIEYETMDSEIDEGDERDPLDLFLSNELEYVFELYDDLKQRYAYLPWSCQYFVNYMRDIIVYNVYKHLYMYEEMVITIHMCINSYLKKYKKELPIKYIKLLDN